MTEALLREVPTQILTERLLIRCPQPGDGVAVFQSVHESLNELREFPASLPWAVGEPSHDASEKYCREGQGKYLLRTDLPMLLFLRQTNIFVGSSGLHRIDWSVPKCEIGFWVRSGFARQGFIAEAVKAITTLAIEQLGMQRVEALPDDENLRSCLVCERAGYRLEGILQNERAEPSGMLRNTRMYAFVP